LLCACIADEEPSSMATAGPGAKADGLDRADRQCRVVLRTLGQPFGLPTSSVDGVNWVVWEGTLDVADDADEVPAVLFTSRSANGWWRIPAKPVIGALDGYQRYSFRLDQKTVPGGDSTAWRGFRIEVIPYLEGEDGSRLFDHNRLSNDFENYVLDQHRTYWQDDANVCR
jgi:hypothetical protein